MKFRYFWFAFLGARGLDHNQAKQQ